MRLSCREGAGGAQALGENFPKQGIKQGFLVNSEQIIKGGGGHLISNLSFCTVLEFKHQSVI